MIRIINIQSLLDHLDALQPTLAISPQLNLQRTRDAAKKGQLANFMEADFVLVGQGHFHKGEKQCPLWRGTRCVIHVVTKYVYAVEDLHDGDLIDVHSTGLKFYSDSLFHTTAIMSNFVFSNTGMHVQRL